MSGLGFVLGHSTLPLLEKLLLEELILGLVPGESILILTSFDRK
jgi:hypothetical protein